MTTRELMEYIAEHNVDDDTDIYELMEEIEQRRQQMIEEIEERQHASGFYAFQDTMEMMRRER